jgi:hypothetical protein
LLTKARFHQDTQLSAIDRRLFFTGSTGGNLLVSRQYPRGDSNRNRVRGDILQNNSVCSDCYIIADPNGPENLGPGSYVYAIANHRRSTRFCVPQSDGHSVADHTVVAKNCVSADNYPAEMIDAKTAT